MAKKKKRKLRLSAKERARRARQAVKNFGGKVKRKMKKRGGSVAKRKNKSNSRSKGTFKLKLPVVGDVGMELLGGIGYAFLEPFIERVTNTFVPLLAGAGIIGASDNIIKALGGALLVKSSSNPILKGVGKAAITIETYKFSRSGALPFAGRGLAIAEDIFA